MNSQVLDETVQRVVASALEGLAMMFLVSEEEAPPWTAGDKRVAAVGFSGPFDGAVALAVNQTLLPELAGNMLGLPAGEAAGPQQQDDALKELVNVTCGNLLPAMAGPRPVFHIGVPELLAEDDLPESLSGRPTAAAIRLCTDAGWISLALYMNQHSTAEAPTS